MLKTQKEKNVYNEFDNFLSGYFTPDYWYDDGFYFAQEILKKFDRNDWKRLRKEFFTKSLEWQLRFIYCVESDINDEEILESLFLFCNTDNNELFEECVDSLKENFVILGIKNVFLKNNSFILRLEEVIPRCDVYKKKIFKDFLSKIK